MQQRLDALRGRFRSLGVANFIVTRFENFKQANMRYLCGYTGSNGVLIVTPKDAYLITDGRYTNQAREQVKGAKVFIYSIGKDPLNPFIREMKENKDISFRGRIGIESRETNVEFYSALKKAFPKSEIVETSNVIEELSAQREPEEIEAIRKAVKITDKVFEEILPLVKPGVMEKELAAEITYRNAQHGAEKDAFESIVASGARAALPHGIASTKKIEKGDFVTFDMGCFVDGYASDFTRTVTVGKATNEQKKIYQIVQDAQRQSVDAIRPGEKCADMDALARKIIAGAGYGEYFTHSLGHGLGHIVHARPTLSRISKDKLKPGNVVTVEPGIYIEGFGGVRIEDDVVVTEDGHEVLNSFRRDLIEL